MARKSPRRDHTLLLDLLDHGWIVKEFNGTETTLVPDPDTHRGNKRDG